MLLTAKEIEIILRKSLPQVPPEDLGRAVNDLSHAMSQWKEVDIEELGAHVSVQCKDICVLGAAKEQGCSIRAFITNGDNSKR